MTLAQLALILTTTLALVGGQLLLKIGMRAQNLRGAPDLSGPARAALLRRTVLCIAGGIAAMTVWFLVWLGLLQELALSHLFPFEGLASALLSLASAWLLREKATPVMWVGILLISLGVALVGLS